MKIVKGKYKVAVLMSKKATQRMGNLKIIYPKGTNTQSTQGTPRHNSSNNSKIQNWLKP